MLTIMFSWYIQLSEMLAILYIRFQNVYADLISVEKLPYSKIYYCIYLVSWNAFEKFHNMKGNKNGNLIDSFDWIILQEWKTCFYK